MTQSRAIMHHVRTSRKDETFRTRGWCPNLFPPSNTTDDSVNIAHIINTCTIIWTEQLKSSTRTSCRINCFTVRVWEEKEERAIYSKWHYKSDSLEEPQRELTYRLETGMRKYETREWEKERGRIWGAPLSYERHVICMIIDSVTDSVCPVCPLICRVVPCFYTRKNLQTSRSNLTGWVVRQKQIFVSKRLLDRCGWLAK